MNIMQILVMKMNEFWGIVQTVYDPFQMFSSFLKLTKSFRVFPQTFPAYFDDIFYYAQIMQIMCTCMDTKTKQDPNPKIDKIFARGNLTFVPLTRMM